MSRLSSMNIGFFDSYRVWGGGEKWHDEMSRYLSAQRHEVTVFTPNNGQLHRRLLGKLRLSNASVDKLSYMNPRDQFRYYRKFRRQKLDVLVFNSFIDVRAAAVAAKKAGVKRTILRIGTPIAPAEKKSYIYTFQNGLDEIVGISKENLDCFYRDAPQLIENKPTRIIPNAIDIDVFKKQEREKNDVITFGNCVRLTDQKGLEDLLKAVYQIKSIGKKFKVLLAGEGEDREKLEAYCTENNLSEVEFLGHVEDTAEFYNRLDFLVFTSRFEGTARTILESMACQVPVISYNASSMKELVVDGENGFLANAFDIEDLQNKIIHFLDNPGIIEEMGYKGRQMVESNYNREIVYKKWADYLTE
jgi:glycosyltransferase involved in cell wall biosynthesis